VGKREGIFSSRGFTALILAAAITFVCIAGHMIVQQSHASDGSNTAKADPVTATVGYDGLRSVSDLALSGNDTQMGKTGEAFAGGYEKLVSGCADQKSFSKSKEEFIKLISQLKEQTFEALDSGDKSAELSAYRSAVKSGFAKLKKYAAQLDTDNSEGILEKIGNIIYSDKTDSRTASELPFSNVSSGIISKAKYNSKKTVSYQITETEYSSVLCTAEGIFADFDAAGVVKRTEYLPENLWLESDKVQFEYLNKLIGGEETGYTWHHTETPGKMELIPYGIHNMVAHNGGRSPGMWAYAKR
jgi:hypothetical protein